MSQKTKYRSAKEVLDSLPQMFSNNDAIMITGIDASQIRVYLNRWTKNDLIVPLGGKSGIYFKDQEAKDRYLHVALQRLYPGMVVIGANVLHDNGLTTQIPHILQIAIPTRRKYTKIDGVAVHLRGKKWYQLVASESYATHENDFPALLPEFALADMLKFRDGWVPDPDDVDFEDMNRALFDKSCEHLKLSAGIKQEFLEYFDHQFSVAPSF
jgi:hypothetical protein